MKVRVRPYRRRRSVHVPLSIPEAVPISSIVDDIREGRRTGYTRTAIWRFDVNDPAHMEAVYDRLLDRTMYVIALNSIPLEDRERMGYPRLEAMKGIGFWRDTKTGIIYADDIVLIFGPKVSKEWVLRFARERRQKYVLKVDGPSRSYEFLPVIASRREA